ncbi:MAG TPA: DEAD/DEAH box helicase, partial [Elusimicrobiales bacterium]|nr:DEAD/DEAH box helicase [Elusimicrobiales bacterium]
TEQYDKLLLSLSVGDIIKRQLLTDKLNLLKYAKVDFVEQPCEYAVRGTVVDIFTVNSQKPMRIYFSLNKIEAIRTFDIETQNTKKDMEKILITPSGFGNTCCKITDWLKDYVYVLDETNTAIELPENILSKENTLKFLPSYSKEKAFDYKTKENIKFFANMDILSREITKLSNSGFKPVVSCLNVGEMTRLENLVGKSKILSLCDFKISPTTCGFFREDGKTSIITASEIFNRVYHTTNKLKKADHADVKRIHFKELSAGDYVVHEDYGIAKYNGIKTISTTSRGNEVSTDCLELHFKLGHKLFVPFYDFKKVQKFISNKSKPPRLSGLDKTRWSQVKTRVKEKTREIALQLLKMEAERLLSKAPSLTGDDRIETEFADSFPYQETQDQKKAIKEILTDLSMPVPNERVLAGDVGFGKTEVAIRAALRTVLGNKQVLVLVPTTILAAQHYKTFTERLAMLPLNIALLCRFQTKSEQKKILKDMDAGVYDIVIGTHRLLSKDVKIKNTGLIIIDEEHRFGVRQKEKIKALASGVHSLLLSATPIPRTLNQALTNLKNLSVIETPPKGRMPITTKVMAWDEQTAINAILAELARGGQIFYVHNRVSTLPGRMQFLKDKLPDVRICMGHGQMESDRLEKTMWDFHNKKYDILLASTIIESGLDIPQVNTLIVENAHQFGLAQLYQLRGRIGRSDRKAYCLLFYPHKLIQKKAEKKQEEEFELDFYARYRPKSKKSGDIQSNAFKRLSALQEFGQLGSGLRLALRDLEIRGAGQLLGIKQHGFLNEVGLFLYTQLLSDQMQKLKGKKAEIPAHASFDTDISAFIPSDYLPDETERLNYYKRLISADYDHSQKILNQLKDLCGHLPQSVKNISEIINIRLQAARAGIRHIVHSENNFEFYLSKGKQIPGQTIKNLVSKYKNDLSFKQSALGDGLLIKSVTKTPFKFIYEVIASLSRLR